MSTRDEDDPNASRHHQVLVAAAYIVQWSHRRSLATMSFVMPRSVFLEQPWERWTFAAATFAFGTALNVFLEPALGVRAPVLPYFPALVATGLCAGAVPSFAILFAASLTIIAFWMGASGSAELARHQEIARIGVFLVAGGMVCAVSAWARHLLLQARDLLEENQRNRNRMDLALAAGQMATWDWDLQSDKLNFSGGAEAVYGSAPRSMSGGWSMVHPDDLERAQGQVRAAVEEGRDFDVLSRVKAKDGEYRWLHSVGHLHRDRAGKSARVSGVTVEVTERHCALEASRAAEARLQVALRAGKVTTWESDAQRRFTWAYNVHLGLQPEVLVGREISDVIRNDSFSAEIERIYATGEDAEFPLSISYQGREFHYLCYLRAGRGDAGKVARIVGAFVDVTELRTVQEQLRVESRRKDTFLATLAHELRNPLAPIRYAVALLGEQATPARRQQAMVVIGRQASHMARLLDDLLDMSRITRNAVELRRQTFDLRLAAEQAAEAMYPTYSELKHRLVLSLPPEPVMVDGDPARLQQVLGNLLDNAAKYTEPGGEVTLRLDRQADAAVIRVRDNGVGIDPARQMDVFELFVQLQGPGRGKGGLGIGLAVVRQLVELHGGTVSVHSEGAGFGAEFQVNLPISDKPTTDSSSEDNVVKLFAHSEKVLVVDDNRDTADTLTTLLRAEGYVVSTAYDGRSALQAFETGNPVVALLDIGLPDMSGIDLARAIRQRSNSAILVAVSGWGRDSDRADSASAGFDFHMVKPVDPSQLRNRLKELLVNRRRGRNI